MIDQYNVEWASADSSYVKGRDGRSYIDFTSGILVANIGHSNKAVRKAIKSQVDDKLIFSYNNPTKIKKIYLNKLCEFSELGYETKAHLVSSGTESTDACLRVFQHYANKKGKGRRVLSINGNYHGRTLGAAFMGIQGVYQNAYPEILHLFPKIDFPYKHLVEEKDGACYFNDQILSLNKNFNVATELCGIILESFQGWGTWFYPSSFVQAVSDFSKRYEIPLAFDEMQAGFYRTGKKFGFQSYGVVPDLICMGKGMGSGFPIAGLVGRATLLDLPQLGELSSTYSANPLACAAGLATIDFMMKKEFQKKLSENVQLFEDLMGRLAKKHNVILERINYMGMVSSLIFRSTSLGNASELAMNLHNYLAKSGLLVIATGREAIKLAPSLIIGQEDLKKGVQLIDMALGQMH